MPINYNSANLDTLISNVIYGYYTKYDTMINLVREYYKGSDATVIDIFIDMGDILRHIDRYLCNSQLPISNPLVISSGIINMVAHYRNLFTTRFSCNSRFWIVDSVDNIIATKYYADFKQKPLSANTAQLYRMNIKLLPIICQSIPDVQYEQTNVDITTKVIAIKTLENKGYPVLIITKDPFVFQAASITTNDITVLRPKKNNFGDVSYMINRYNCVVSYINELSKEKVNTVNISPNQLTTFMALTRVPSRNIKTYFQMTTTIERLYQMYAKGFTTEYPWIPFEFFTGFLSLTPKKRRDPYELMFRLQACDAIYTQYTAYQSMPEYLAYKGIVNIYDPRGIKEINDTHFKSCPLDLNVL